ncbi:AraC family transcriptional regulator [Cesiribacter sp. SM1]|uniref:helix-turn-helix domain-containing protein n=1 Tax=Cesiribacter sp. SM1 TaxID=2861196 RepID=UPI001CD38ED6|nr:helix-turn-helix transcriptional regulator [Cesiribacter sp. SM1]
MTSEILIKGMVCNRCITVLKADLEKTGLTVKEISMGRVVFDGEIDEQMHQQIRSLLLGLEFDLLIDRQTKLIQQIKEIINTTLDTAVHGAETRLKLSRVLADKMNLGYSSLSEIFSRSEGITIEQYVIRRRLAKVKELLKFTDSTLTEIAYLTGFSSVHHLSKHFKDLTGVSPSQYRLKTNTAPELCAA